MRHQFRRGLVLAAVIALSLILMTGTAAGEPQLAKEQVLRYATDARSFPPFDPIASQVNVGYPVQNMVFDSLVRYRPGSANIDEIEPALATSWEVSEGGAVWTFHLRRGVEFQRGFGPLTSEDIKFSLERARGSESVVASRYRLIKSVETPDPYTVVVRLSEPDAFFLTKVANKFAGWIVSKRAVEKLGEEHLRKPVGSGPFYIAEVVPGEKVVLRRNERYWRGKPVLERVEYILMPDLTTRTLALLNGEVDAIRGAVSKPWAERVKNAGMQMGYASPGQLILNFNMTIKPFDDIRVRKAFAYALGREGVLRLYGPDVIAPMYTAVPSYIAGSIPPDQIPGDLLYKRDVKKARQLLAEAGFPNGLKVSTVISEHPDYLNPMQVWQEQLKEVGIDLELEVVDHTTFHNRIRTDQYPLVVYGGVRDPIPDVWLYEWYHSDAIVGRPGGITNFSHYGEVDADGDGKVDSIDMFIEQARKTLDPQEQKRLWKQAQIQLLEHLPAFPSHVVNICFAWHPYVDLGYKLEASVVDALEVWETTRILKH